MADAMHTESSSLQQTHDSVEKMNAATKAALGLLTRGDTRQLILIQTGTRWRLLAERERADHV